MLNWLKGHSTWAKYFILGAALIGVYKTFDNLSALWTGLLRVFDAIKPFIIAFVVAYMLNIPTRKLKSLFEKKVKWKFVSKHSTGLSIAVVYVIFIVLLVWLVLTVIPALLGNFVDMYSHIPQYAQSIVDFANSSEIVRKIGIHPEALDLSTRLSRLMDNFLSFDIMKDGLRTITTGVWSFASGFMDLFIALIASVYMLIDKDRILRAIYKLASKFNGNGKADSFIRHWSNVNEIFTQYIYSRLICCSVMAVVCTLILLLMGEKYALLLGIFIGFMDLIPYFGSIISWVVGFVVMVISGGWSHGIWCSAVILLMQQLDGNILAPKVTGDRLEIRPLTIIIAVSVGGTLFGFAGMLISVPVVAILRVVLDEFIENKTTRNKG